MNYCKLCLIPDTRPDQYLKIENNDFTICNACLSFKNRSNIDWTVREKKLKKIILELKASDNKWNCIIPSSGGKDSTYQAIRARELGLNPLIVTATTCHLSDLGRYNIENLKKLGFDTIEFSANHLVRKRLNKICLKEIGDISWPEHVSIFTIPIKIAVKFNISLIIYGENPQIEYGGPDDSLNNFILDKKWLEEFGGLIGLRVNDLYTHYGFEKKELEFLEYPSAEELKKVNINAIFLGYFEPWDNIKNADIAKKNGFKDFGQSIEGGYLPYEKIDNYQHGIHDYFKYLKFGFGRASDQVSLLIRRNLLTRTEGINIVDKNEGYFPKSYLGKPIKEILNYIDMTLDEFIEICDKFTNKKIFKRNQAGQLIKDDNGNLIKVFEPK
jgi:N-acetyl sugar amidotransferase